MAMLEQHLGIAINLALIAIVSRLLSPAEVGFAVIGYGVTSVIFAFREFVSSDFLIQLDVVERDDINTSLTLLLLVSGILGIVLYLCGPYLAIFYHQPGLQHYLILAIAAVMAESPACRHFPCCVAGWHSAPSHASEPSASWLWLP